MKNQKYKVELSQEERGEIEKFVKSASKKHTEQNKVHAKIILCLDEKGATPLTVRETAIKCKVHQESVYKIRKQFVTEGAERILKRKKRETPPVAAKVTGEVEAHIIATACSKAPEGRSLWTMQLIADKIIADGVVESISDETVRRTLKKRNISLT